MSLDELITGNFVEGNVTAEVLSALGALVDAWLIPM